MLALVHGLVEVLPVVLSLQDGMRTIKDGSDWEH